MFLQIGFNSVEHIDGSDGNSRAWAKYTLHACLVERVVILRWYDASSDHDYVAWIVYIIRN